jgi:hypothetical protein
MICPCIFNKIWYMNKLKCNPLIKIVYFNSIISVKISSVWTLSPYFTICILIHLIIFPYFSTVIFDFFVLFFRQSKLQRRKLLSVGRNVHLWFAWRMKKECRSVALLKVVLSRPSNQNRGRVWVSVKLVWTCLNMLGLISSVWTLSPYFTICILIYLSVYFLDNMEMVKVQESGKLTIQEPCKQRSKWKDAWFI